MQPARVIKGIRCRNLNQVRRLVFQRLKWTGLVHHVQLAVDQIDLRTQFRVDHRLQEPFDCLSAALVDRLQCALAQVLRIHRDGYHTKAAIQEEKVRITGAKRDDLQAAMALIRKDVTDIPLTFDNFRD